MTKDITFMDVTECLECSPETGMATFKNIDGKEIRTSFITVTDSSYGNNSKCLFTTERKTNGRTGADRLLSFSNSILFPDAKEDDFKLREVEYLNSEATKLDKAKRKSFLQYDIPFIGKCWNEKYTNIKGGKRYLGLDIGMVLDQRRNENLFERLLCYNLSLTDIYKMGFTQISLLNFENNDNSNNIVSQDEELEDIMGMRQYFFDNKNKPTTKMFDFGYEVLLPDLEKNKEKIRNNETFEVYNGNINEIGMAWLKLLGVKQWAMKVPNSNPPRYILPSGTKGLDKNILSALTILSRTNDVEFI